MRIADVNALDRDGFVARLGGVFELSQWVADAVWAARPFASVDALFGSMTGAVDGAAPAAQLELLRAHPDLAGKAARAGDLTAHSRDEQAGAGLDQLSSVDFARFHELNGAYRDKFGFPSSSPCATTPKRQSWQRSNAGSPTPRPRSVQRRWPRSRAAPNLRLRDLLAD